MCVLYAICTTTFFELLVHGQQHKGPEKYSDTALHGGRHDIPGAEGQLVNLAKSAARQSTHTIISIFGTS